MDFRSLIRWFLPILLPVSVLAFAACGDDEKTTDGTASPTRTEAADGGEIDISGVPELEDGTLNIGSDIAYAPIEFQRRHRDTRRL
jgi:hypothetical protein